MARKKPVRTRVQQYKAQRRKSWIRFLTKITLFFVPVIALTIWLIFFLIPFGDPLPILVLDLDAKPEREQRQTWKRIKNKFQTIFPSHEHVREMRGKSANTGQKRGQRRINCHLRSQLG